MSQSPSKMMFVHFDDTGEMLSIGPQFNNDFEQHRYAVFPLEEVMPFLSGDRSMHYYAIKRLEGNKHKIVEKKQEIDNIRVIDRFLTEVKHDTKNPDLLIVHNVSTSNITVSIDPEIRKHILKTNDTINTSNVTVNGVPFIHLYFTVKGDPSFLVYTIDIPTNALLNEESFVYNYDPKDVNITDCSLYTKKIFDRYRYEIE